MFREDYECIELQRGLGDGRNDAELGMEGERVIVDWLTDSMFGWIQSLVFRLKNTGVS